MRTVAASKPLTSAPGTSALSGVSSKPSPIPRRRPRRGPAPARLAAGVPVPAEREVQRTLVVAAVEPSPVDAAGAGRRPAAGSCGAGPRPDRPRWSRRSDPSRARPGASRRPCRRASCRPMAPCSSRRCPRADAADVEGVARAGRLRADEPHAPAVARGHRAMVGARVDVEREQAPVGGERRAPALHLLARAGQQGGGALLVPAHGTADEPGEHRDEKSSRLPNIFRPNEPPILGAMTWTWDSETRSALRASSAADAGSASSPTS